MNKSIAVWTDNTTRICNLHINYWIVKRYFTNRDHFIDIGIKIPDWEGGNLYLFSPISIKKDSVIDLGSQLRDKRLANSLFNENCTIVEGQEKRLEITWANNSISVFQLDINNDVKITPKYEGTIVTFKIPKLTNTPYIRFRLKIPPSNTIERFIKTGRWDTIKNQFSQKQTPKGSFYQSARTSTEAIDFRINDKRSLNVSLLDEKSQNFLALDKLHFFIIHDIDEELHFSSRKAKKVRLLENEDWRDYLGGLPGNNRKFCACHWSCNPTDGWTVFLKLRYASANWFTLLRYFLYVVILAGAINLSSAFLYDLIKNGNLM